jgi:hypothetical protein
MIGKGKVLKAMAAAVSLVLGVVMLGCNGGDGDAGLAGDWRVVSQTHADGSHIVTDKTPDDRRLIFSFKSSGEAMLTIFQNVGNFWLEREEEKASYQNNGSEIYFISKHLVEGDTIKADTVTYQYKIDGDRLTLTGCYYSDYDKKNYCDEVACTKTNLADVKKSLGAIYTLDLSISGAWTMKVQQEDGSLRAEYLRLDSSGYFYGGSYYIDAEDSYGYWCTNGIKLILVDDDDYTIQKELNYSVSGSGKGRTLKIDGKTWTLDDDYLYSQAKSRRDKNVVENGKGAFSPLLGFIGRATGN